MTYTVGSSEARDRRAYMDYYLGNNTMNLDSKDIAKIVDRWSDKISFWKKEVDENIHNIDPKDFDSWYDEGFGQAQSAAGYTKEDESREIGQTAAMTTLSAGGAACGLAGSAANLVKCGGSVVSAGLDGLGKMFGGATTKSGGAILNASGNVTKGAENVANGMKDTIGKSLTTEGSKVNVDVGDVLSYVAIAMALIVVAIYYAKKPNSEGAEACRKMMEEFDIAQDEMASGQKEMKKIQKKIRKSSDEANKINDKANSEIEKQKTTYDTAMRTYMSIQAKIDSGVPLTESDKSLYKSVTEIANKIAAKGGIIETTAENAHEKVKSVNKNIEKHSTDFDDLGTIVAKNLGIIDYAESFDTNTRAMAITESVSQGMNVASATFASIKLMASSVGIQAAWNIPIALAGLGAAIASGFAMKEQIDIAKIAKEEIAYRDDITLLNADFADEHEIEIEDFYSAMADLKHLEIRKPRELKEVSTSAFKSEDNTKKIKEDKDK